MVNSYCKQINDTIDNADGGSNNDDENSGSNNNEEIINHNEEITNHDPHAIFEELRKMVIWRNKEDVAWDKFTKVFQQALEANIAKEVLEQKDDDWGMNLFFCLFTVKGGPRIDIVKMILEVNQKVVCVKDNYGYTCLHNCISYNSPLDIVKYIIDIYPEATIETNRSKMTPLHCIGKETSLDVVKYIVETKPETTIMRDSSDRTPLEMARIYDASEDVIQYLSEYKHEYYFDGQTHTPLEGTILTAFRNLNDKVSYVDKYDNNRRKPKKNDDMNWEDLRNFISSLGSEMIGRIMTCCYDNEERSILNYLLRIKGGRPQFEIFEILLKECPDAFSMKDHDGKIALHHTIESNSVTADVVKLIIDNNDQTLLIEKDNKGNTPLHYITPDTSFEIIKWIVEKNSEATAMKDADGKVILHHAIERNSTADVVKFIFDNTNLKTLIERDIRNTALLRYIVQNNIYNSETTAVKDEHGQVVLHYAVERNFAEDVVKLIVDNTDQSLLIKKDDKGKSPLHYIHKSNSLEIIRLIIGKNSEATAVKDADGKVILHHAIERNIAADVVKFIIDKTEQHLIIEKDNNENTPLHYITQKTSLEIIKWIVKKDSKATAVKDANGKVMLHHAIEHNLAADVVKFIIDNTEQHLIIEKDNNENTPLHYITQKTSLEIVTWIFEKSSVATAVKGADGKVVLHYAIERNSASDVVKFLFENADQNLLTEKDNKSKTPLHYITQKTSMEIVEKIISVCPKIVLIKDTGGKLVHEIAIKENLPVDVRRVLCETYLKEAPKPKFPDYPKPTHGGNGTVKPIFWGMTLAQFNSFIDVCEENHTLWEALRYQNLGTLKEEPFISGYDINDYFVKEFTAKFGSGVALRINSDNPRRAQIMVSHPWGEDIKETQRSLNDSIEDKSTVIWFCIFANYQNEDGYGPSLTEQIKMEPFKQVISIPDLQGMVVIHSSKVELYDRKWCVHEIDEALERNLKIIMGCSAEYLDAMLWGNLDFQVDTASAKCSMKSDEDYIDSLVTKKDGGYDRLNRVIHQFRERFLETEVITVTVPARESASLWFADTKPPMVTRILLESICRREGVTVGSFVTNLTMQDGKEYKDMTRKELIHLILNNKKQDRVITFHKPKTKVKRKNLENKYET